MLGHGKINQYSYTVSQLCSRSFVVFASWIHPMNKVLDPWAQILQAHDLLRNRRLAHAHGNFSHKV